MKSFDIISIWICGFQFTIRLYNEGLFGWRKLGMWRYSLDISRISFIFERYWLN